jgi:nucleotide-binding universal stress UspA family protein
MYEHILVPVDGSATSRAGLDAAIELAHAGGGSLRLVHALDALRCASGFETCAAYADELLPLLRREGESLLEADRKRATARGVTAETRLIEQLGLRASEAALQEAKAWPADLIVVGTHGRRGIQRALLGSDAEQIARQADVPVLLVRRSGDGTAEASQDRP